MEIPIDMNFYRLTFAWASASSSSIRCTVPLTPIKTSAKEQPEAEAKFTDTLINRGASVRAGSPYRLTGTTIRNALLPFDREGASRLHETISKFL